MLPGKDGTICLSGVPLQWEQQQGDPPTFCLAGIGGRAAQMCPRRGALLMGLWGWIPLFVMTADRTAPQLPLELLQKVGGEEEEGERRRGRALHVGSAPQGGG